MKKRAALYDALVGALVVPSVRFELDESRIDKRPAAIRCVHPLVTLLPTLDEPALHLADADKRAEVERACAKIAPMFWGPPAARAAMASRRMAS